MKYVFYGLAVFAILQALAMSVLIGTVFEKDASGVLLSFIYGAVSGSIAGKLFILGWEEK